MRLIDWMNKNKLSQRDVAQAVGVKQPTVSRWVNGEIAPSFLAIVKIKNLTNGAVCFDDFINYSKIKFKERV